tara:strand:+ start:155 stop:298 length:144 start_codon:yes stop_codon:yes gene_type:complete
MSKINQMVKNNRNVAGMPERLSICSIHSNFSLNDQFLLIKLKAEGSV